MRKFTKEISALLAATAMSASVCIASSAESPENELQPSTVIERTAGVATISNEEYFPPEEGEAMPEDYIQPTTLAPTEVPPPIGTYVYEEPTEEIPPLIGEPMPPDETIEPTTIPTVTTLPPVTPLPHSIGTWVYEDPEEETTVPKGEERIKPTLRGDADMNGMVDLADLVAVSKHVLNRTAFPLKNSANADMNGDGVIDGVDISALIEEQLGS